MQSTGTVACMDGIGNYLAKDGENEDILYIYNPWIFLCFFSSESIVERISGILRRESSQPMILSREGTSLSLAETLEILTRATATLRQGAHSCKSIQCCASKYIEFGSGSGILVHLDPDPGLRYRTLSILKEKLKIN